MANPDAPDGLSRRGFLKAVGLGSLAAAARPGSAEAGKVAGAAVHEAGERVPVALRVNGVTLDVLVEPRWTLVYVLREELGLTGTKESCGRGECGSCTVLVDDEPRYGCLTLALEAQGHEITTVEGLLDGEELGPVQAAFVEHDAMQCGYCTPGQVLAVEGLLRRDPSPSDEAIRVATSGNLCRCGTYDHIARAARAAADARSGGGS